MSYPGLLAASCFLTHTSPHHLPCSNELMSLKASWAGPWTGVGMEGMGIFWFDMCCRKRASHSGMELIQSTLSLTDLQLQLWVCGCHPAPGVPASTPPGLFLLCHPCMQSPWAVLRPAPGALALPHLVQGQHPQSALLGWVDPSERLPSSASIVSCFSLLAGFLGWTGLPWPNSCPDSEVHIKVSEWSCLKLFPWDFGRRMSHPFLPILLSWGKGCWQQHFSSEKSLPTPSCHVHYLGPFTSSWRALKISDILHCWLALHLECYTFIFSNLVPHYTLV